MFTTEQIKAMRHTEGAAMVMACPGSGKTRVITGRVHFLQEEKGVPPDRILVVTFAKDAALQMQKRYLQLTGEVTTGVVFSTIHSLCYTILKKSSLFRDYRLLTDTERKQIFSNLLQRYKTEINPESRITIEGIRGVSMDITRCKCSCFNGSDKDSFKPKDSEEDMFRFFYKAYSDEMLKRRTYDFDDMTGMAMEAVLRDKTPEINAIRKRFLYILIDEFQDTSAAQFYLLRSLCENIYVVGDTNQSIYGFRGANPDIINTFKDSFPHYYQYTLSKNFRSTNEIVTAAVSVISENNNRQAKSFISSGNHISHEVHSFGIEEYENRHDEAEGIVKFLNDTSYGSEKTVAILTRTNEEAVFIAAVLQKNGKKFNIRESFGSMFDHPAIVIYISYFRIALGTGDPKDFVNIFRHPSSVFPASCFYGAKGIHDCWERVFKFADNDPELKTELLNKRAKLDYMRELDPVAALNFAGKALFLDKWFSKHYENAVVYKERMNEFAEFLKLFSSLEAFLAYEKNHTKQINEPEKYNEKDKGKEKITIMTMHAAKGLEFDAVWIPGSNEGNIPFSKALKTDDTTDVEEERRLFYVAMTRAVEVLRISYRKTGSAGRGNPSRFLKSLRKL